MLLEKEIAFCQHSKKKCLACISVSNSKTKGHYKQCSFSVMKDLDLLKLFTLKLSIVFNIVIWPLEWKVFQGRVLLEHEELSSMFVFIELVGIESHSTERRCGRPDESLLQYLAVAKT